MWRTMIKAIIFDLGGVLVDLDLDRCRKAFVEDVGYGRIDELLDAWHQKGFYSDLEEGKISEDEFRHRIIEGVSGKRPVLPEDVDRAMWALLTGIEPYKVDLLKDLSHRYDLYLLSNNNGISMARCRKFFADAGLPMEQVFEEFAGRVELEDVENFAAVFSAAKRSGGDMIGIIQNTVGQIGDKIEIHREIDTILAAKKYEFKVMSWIPYGIIFYLILSFPEFTACLYGNIAGTGVMTICLLVYTGACVLGEKLVDIEV